MQSLLQGPPEPEDEAKLVNIEAEQAILGALLINNNAFVHIGQLRPHHFSDALHTAIFISIHEKWASGGIADPISLKFEFPEHYAYLAKLLVNANTVVRIAEYISKIIDLAQRRFIIERMQKTISALTHNSDQPAFEIALQMTNNLNENLSGYQENVFQDDYEVTEEILRDMKKDERPFSTGYTKLDDAMGGGLFPGKSYGFAARKKVGKTIMAGSISSNLNIMGVRHLFICGEMSPAEIQKRTLARLLRIHAHEFTRATSKQDQLTKRIAEVAASSKRSIIYRNAPGITFDDLKRYVMLARMQKKITGFILDYWQLVGGKPKNKSTAEHLDEVAQWIADVCRKYGLWSITMAQINQEGNTRGGEGIRLAFDQVYTLQAPNEDPGRRERWLEMSDTRYTPWKSVGSQNNPGFYLNEKGPYFSETADDNEELGL